MIATHQTEEAFSRRNFIAFLVIAIITFCVYFTIGLKYITGPLSPYHELTTKISGEAFLQSYPGWNDKQEFDDAAYNRAAVEVMQRGVPRDHSGSLFLYAPVYAYFLAACYWLGGLRLLAFAIPQAAVAAITSAVVVAITYRVSRSNKLATGIAALLFIVHARLAIYVGFISPTLLLILFFSVAVLAATGPLTPVNLSIFVVSLLLASGTQAGFFSVTIAAAAWLIIRFVQTRNSGSAIAAFIILIFSAGKPFLPVLAGQNQKGSVNESGQGILWEANNPCYEDMTIFSLWERRPGNRWSSWKLSDATFQKYNNYLERAHHRTIAAAFLWIREHPAQYAKLVFVRLWTTLGPFTGMMSPRNRLIGLFLWLLIFPAGVYGWWVHRRDPIANLVVLVAVVVVLSGALVITDWYLRYRLPLEFFTIVYAAITYSSLLHSRISDPR